MRDSIKISFILLLLSASHVGFANTTETDGKKETEEDNTELNQTGQQQEKLDEEGSAETVLDDVEILDTDSIEDDSVNKYNFIFHFLYKFKYDHEDF